MILQIECTALQLKTIGEALHRYDFSGIEVLNIPKYGWALAGMCQEWIDREKECRKDKEDIVRFNKLLVELSELGKNKKTQEKALKLFRENRNFIWGFLVNCDEDKVLKELELLINDKGLICSIIQIFVIVKFESVVRHNDKKEIDNE